MKSSIALILFSVFVCSFAQNLTSTGCTDPSNFQSCYDTATVKAQSCLNVCGNSNECVIACECTMYKVQIGCLVQSCWNKAYNCEYQKFAVAFADFCSVTTSDIPFWPAPEDAPSSCSCNLENVFDAVKTSKDQVAPCTSRVSKALLQSDPAQGSKNDTGCQCCAASGAVSALYDICPDTDPSLLRLSDILTEESYALNGPFSKCDSTLGTFNCVQDLDFPQLPGKGTYFANSNLPPNGTATLSDIPGSVTSPPSGSVVTFTLDSTPYTISAAPYNSNNAAATTGAQASTSATQSPSSTSKSLGQTNAPSWIVLTFAFGALLVMKNLRP